MARRSRHIALSFFSCRFVDWSHMKRIAIFEYVGCQEDHGNIDYSSQTDDAIEDVSNELAKKQLLSEGDAMLLAYSQGLSKEYQSEVHACRHTSIGPIQFDSNTPLGRFNHDLIHWHWIERGASFLDVWQQVAKICDMSVVVAPEIDGELLIATRFLRSHGIRLLNADDQFIAVASDKAMTARIWRRSRIRQPWTSLRCNALKNIDTDHPASDHGRSAWIVKPRDGAGGSGIKKFKSLYSLLAWMDSNPMRENQVLIQPWIEGISGSIAIDFRENEHAIMMPARNQFLHESNEQLAARSASGDAGREVPYKQLSYAGSGDPWPSDCQSVAEKFARRAIGAIPGVPLGWIGLDFVCDGSPLNIDSYIAIEINPRLTSSYVTSFGFHDAT